MSLGKGTKKGFAIRALLSVLSLTALLAFGVADAHAQGNAAQAVVKHDYSYTYGGDAILDEPVLMMDGWKWFVGNFIDTGEAMENVKFTAEVPFPLAWWAAPTFSSPPIYAWDYGIDVPENNLYTEGGRIEPGVVINPGLTAVREVVPPTLEGTETLQTLKLTVTFTEVPPASPSVGIGMVNAVLYEPQVKTEVLSQDDLPGWTESVDYARANWHMRREDVQVGVPYVFTALLKSVKSPIVVGNPTWKPPANVDMSDGAEGPAVTGSSASLSHPHGVNVTFETANTIEWHPLSTWGKEVFIEEVIAGLESSVDVDIKPGSDINPVNVTDRGVLPVAIRGSEYLDVALIDTQAILLEGVAPIRWSIEEVDGDGFADLALKFDVQELFIYALLPVSDGEVRTLTLTGQFSNGTSLSGEDTILILAKNK